MAAPGPKKRRRIDDTANLPPNHTFPLPSKRFQGQKPPRNRSLKISDEAADVVFTRAFHQRLESEIISMAKATAASNQKLAEDEVLEKFDEQKTKLLQNDRVPRGLYEQADKMGGYPSQTTYRHFTKQNSIVARWRIFVTEYSHQNIEYALTKYSEFAEEICQRSNTLTGGTRIRTCEVPLSKVIRSDLPPEHKELFKQRLQEIAIMLTNAGSDLSAIALMLECGRVGFKPTPDNQYVVLREESEIRKTDISEFLPAFAQRNKEYILDGRYIPISDIRKELHISNKCSDFSGLFHQVHIQSLYSQYLSNTRGETSASREKHPLWFQLSLPNVPQKIDAFGQSLTVSSAVQRLSTNLENMWSGSLFQKSLDRILLVCLRTALAPEREQRYYDLVHQKAEVAKKEVEARKTVRSLASIAQDLRKDAKYRTKCNLKASAEPAGSPEQIKWAARGQLAIQRIAKKKEQILKLKLANSKVNQASDNRKPGDVETTELEVTKVDTQEDCPALDNIDCLVRKGVEHDCILESILDLDEDIDDKESDIEDTVTANKVSDVPAWKIRSFKAILKRLLLENCQDITTSIKKSWTNSTEITDRELTAMLRISKALMPFMPPKDCPKRIIALHLPMVLLSNTIQRVCGYPNFAREICPSISAGTIHAVHLDATSLYEMMATDEIPQNFTLFDQYKMPITSVQQAIRNQVAVLSSFLDIAEIQKICMSRGLEFENVVTICANGSAKLLGVLKTGVTPATSYYDERKKTNAGGKRQKSNLTFSDAQKAKAKDFDAKIKELENSLRRQNSALQKVEKEIRDLKKARNAMNENPMRQIEILKARRYQYYASVNDTRLQVKRLRSAKYEMLFSKVKKGPVKSQKAPTVPTNEKPAHEDSAEHIEINTLLKDAETEGRTVVFSGTDYGICTMSTTVAMPIKRYEAHIKLYNRFAQLTVEEPMDDAIEAEDLKVACPSREKIIRVTAGELDQLSLSRTHAKKRERRKSLAPQVIAAEKSLAKNSVKTAVTASQVMERHKETQTHRDILREFYHSNRHMKESRSQQIQTRRAYDKVAALERRRISEDTAQEGKLKSRLVMCIGVAGTGVGSRVKGHARRGGTQMRSRHRRYQTVAMTNEYCSSQTCSTCFSPATHPKQRKLVNGVWKMRTCNGSTICLNPRCPSFQAGINTRNRDAEAAKCILLAGISRMLTGDTLPPFNPKPSQYKTGFPVHFGPPVTMRS